MSLVTPLLVLGCLASAGCVSTREEQTRERWEAAVARRGVDPAKVPFPMEATREVRELARSLAGPGTANERLGRIHAALLDPSGWALHYELEGTYTASEALQARRGNCVAFTNLFIAMGRSLGLRVRAALATRRGSAEKEGDLVLVYGHLLAVLPQGTSVAVFDFYSRGQSAYGGVRILDDLAVAAIIESNRGVAALRRGDLPAARDRLETAVRLDPDLGAVHANLGLVRWRMGEDAAALSSFRAGLEVEPGSPSLLQNLAAFYVEKGRADEARAALAAARPGSANPFLLVVRGNLLLSGGDAKGALRSFRAARRLDRRLVEPLLGIARAERARKRPERAREALEEAARLAPGNEEVRRLLEAR